jgi:hypothetical protein
LARSRWLECTCGRMQSPKVRCRPPQEFLQCRVDTQDGCQEQCPIRKYAHVHQCLCTRGRIFMFLYSESCSGSCRGHVALWLCVKVTIHQCGGGHFFIRASARESILASAVSRVDGCQGLALWAAATAMFNQLLFVQSRVAMLDVFEVAFLVWGGRSIHAQKPPPERCVGQPANSEALHV